MCAPCRQLQRTLKNRSTEFRPGFGLNAHSLNKMSALATHFKKKYDELYVKQLDSLGASIQAAIGKHGDGFTRSMPYCSFEKFVRAAVNGTRFFLSCLLPFRRLATVLLLISDFHSLSRLPLACDFATPGDLRANRFDQRDLNHSLYMQWKSGKKGIAAMRGRGGAGLGSHGSLPFDCNAFNVFTMANSTINSRKPPVDVTVGVRHGAIADYAALVRSDPLRMSNKVQVCADGVSVVGGIAFFGSTALGATRGPIPIEELLAAGLTRADLATELFVFLISEPSGKALRAVAAYPARGISKDMLLKWHTEVVDALLAQDLTPITFSTDGAHASYLLELEQIYIGGTHKLGLPFMDYPHEVKIALNPLRGKLPKTLTVGAQSFSIQVLKNAVAARLAGFEHLTIDENITPRDKQKVEPARRLISEATVTALFTLPEASGAWALALYLENLRKFWDCFDVKRTIADETLQPNPEGKRVYSLADRAAELERLAAYFLSVRVSKCFLPCLRARFCLICLYRCLHARCRRSRA